MKKTLPCVSVTQIRKILLSVFSGLFLSVNVCGQDDSDDHLFGREMKCIEFASPNEWSFYKYIENPINLYNGTPDVALTLYTLKDCGIELPLTLRYNTSGIKVEEEASWVGLGWNLNVGGSITCNIVDGYDGRDDTFYKYKDIFYNPNTGYVYQNGGMTITSDVFDQLIYHHQETDTDHWGKLSPDVYYFTCPGNAGKYVVDHRDNSVRILQREQDLLIDNNIPGSSAETPGKSIVTPEGVRHEYVYSDQTVNRFHLTPVSQTFVLIRSLYPNGAQIGYEYGYFRFSRKKVSSYICGTLPSRGEPYYDAFKSQSDIMHNETYLDGTESYLSVVSTPNYRIEFEVSPRRDYVNGQKLDRIIIRGKNGGAVKQFEFEYDYFTPAGSVAGSASNLRLKLTRVYEKSVQDGSAENAYRFTYNTTPLPDKLSYSTDYWGYANSSQSQAAGNILPELNRLYWSKMAPGNDYNHIAGIMGPKYDKSHNFEYCQAGMLTDIWYPTGGRTSFKYESNSFWGKWIPSSHEKTETEYPRYTYTIKDQNYSGDKSSASIQIGGLRKFDISYTLYRGYNSWKDVAKSLVRLPFSTSGFYPEILADFEAECLRRYDSGDKSSTITGSTSVSRKAGTHAFQVTFPDELGNQFSSSGNHGYVEATISYKDQDPTVPIVKDRDTVSYGCGMRIAAIEYYDAGASSPMMTKRYAYNLPGTQRTSGKLFDKPKFENIYENAGYGYLDKKEISNPNKTHVLILKARQFEIFDRSISSNPYGSNSGVGYSCVTETIDGQDGSTEYCFHSGESSSVSLSYCVDDPLNGKKSSKTIYDRQGGVVE